MITFLVASVLCAAMGVYILTQRHRMKDTWWARAFYYFTLAWCASMALTSLVFWAIDIGGLLFDLLTDPAVVDTLKHHCLKHHDYCIPVLERAIHLGLRMKFDGEAIAAYAIDVVSEALAIKIQ
jgi:hypothetical protein